MPKSSGRQRSAQSSMSPLRKTSFQGCSHGAEAGATVRINTNLRDMNLSLPATDERAIEVFASGLPIHHGAQFAVDITTRSAVTATGRACPLPQLMGLCSPKPDADCQLVVVGVETGGRWSPEAVTCEHEKQLRHSVSRLFSRGGRGGPG